MSDQGTAVDQAAHESAVATARAEGVTEGRIAGATAERERISAILGSAEAKERPVAAMAVAMDTDKTVEAASTFLAKMPAETAKGGKGTDFDGAMSDNPNLHAEGNGGDAEGSVADSIFASAGFAPLPARTH